MEWLKARSCIIIIICYHVENRDNQRSKDATLGVRSASFSINPTFSFSNFNYLLQGIIALDTPTHLPKIVLCFTLSLYWLNIQEKSAFHSYRAIFFGLRYSMK